MSEVATTRPSGGDIIEAVITKGDLARLTAVERTQYYNEVCRSIGLNPFTRPFEYISLNGKLTLYARREATDQLRKINGIDLEIVSRQVTGDILTVHVRAKDKSGRTDEDFGSVNIAGLRGEALANQQMKAVTKAKRRVTLSISGLGFIDESEVDDIGHERPVPQDTRAQLDQFAGIAPPHDPDTGEIRSEHDQDGADKIGAMVERGARLAARRGTEALREHLQAMEPPYRALLRPFIGTREAPGELTMLAQRADAEALGEHTPAPEPPAAAPPPDRRQPRRPAADGEPNARRTAAGEQGSPQPSRPGQYHVTRQGDTSTDWEGWEKALLAMIDSGDDPAGILRDNRDDLKIFQQLDEMRHHALTQALGVP